MNHKGEMNQLDIREEKRQTLLGERRELARWAVSMAGAAQIWTGAEFAKMDRIAALLDPDSPEAL